jgi:hypothetical protein
MKSRKEHNLIIATVGAWWLSKVVAPARAMQYCRAAQRDEQNGFACTAAMEWRKAAELFACNGRIADHCWQQWERIMQLPRRLAEPIGVAQAVHPSEKTAPIAQFPTECGTKKVSFATAA